MTIATMVTSSERQSAVSRRRGIGRPVALAVSIIVTSIALIAWGGTYSSTYKDCQAIYEAEVAQAADNNPPKETIWPTTRFVLCEAEFLEKHEGIIVALATVVIAAFTIILGIATHVLADETKRLRGLANAEGGRTEEALKIAREQVSVAQQNLVISNRAWIFAQPWPGETKFEGRDIEIPRMEIKHYGDTPALVTELYVGFTDETRGEEPTFSKEPIRTTYGLAMGNRWPHWQKFPTTTAEPIVYGYVRYTDAFKNNRESRFCYRLTSDEPCGFRPAGTAGWCRVDRDQFE